MKKYCGNNKVVGYINNSLLISYIYTGKGEVENFKIHYTEFVLDIEDIVPIIFDVYPIDTAEILPIFEVENEDVLDIKMGTIIPKQVGQTVVTIKTPNGNSIIGVISVTIKNRDIQAVQDDDIYNVDISAHNIFNNGTVECADAINNMMSWAKNQGYKKVILPKGTYLIGAMKSVTIISNMILDLGGATLKKEVSDTNAEPIILVPNTVSNCRITNGTLHGDRLERQTTDYSEFVHGMGVIGSNIEIDNLTITQIQGYGIYFGRGSLNAYCNIPRHNLIEKTTNNWTTIDYIDISKIGDKLEIGNPFGMGGWGGLKDSAYFNIRFYDSNKQFISSSNYIKFARIIQKPINAKYVMLDVNNTTMPDTGNLDFGNSVNFICDFNLSDNIYIHDCKIEYCRSLGLAYCGDGLRNKIVNCVFDNNGGIHATADVDFEDGWDAMRYVVMRDCTFGLSSTRSLVLCAGESLVFYNNQFNGGIVVDVRTMHTRFINNTFDCTGRSSMPHIELNAEWYSGAIFLEGNTFVKTLCFFKNARSVENAHRFYFKDNYWKSCTFYNNSTHEVFRNLCVSNDTILNGKFENIIREDR